MGGSEVGGVRGKKNPDDPKPPGAQILGQIGPGKAEKRLLELRSPEANPATSALLAPAAAAWGGGASVGHPCGYNKAPNASEIAKDGPCHKDS